MIDPIRCLRESVVNYAGFSFKIYDGVGDPKGNFPMVVNTPCGKSTSGFAMPSEIGKLKPA